MLEQDLLLFLMLDQEAEAQKQTAIHPIDKRVLVVTVLIQEAAVKD